MVHPHAMLCHTTLEAEGKRRKTWGAAFVWGACAVMVVWAVESEATAWEEQEEYDDDGCFGGGGGGGGRGIGNGSIGGRQWLVSGRHWE